MVNYLQFAVQVVYHLECSACGAVATQTWNCAQGNMLAMPIMPHLWTAVAGRLYCPKHKLKLEVDGVGTVLL